MMNPEPRASRIRRSVRRIAAVFVATILALIPALFSMTAAVVVAALSALIFYLRWGRRHTGVLRASAYVVVGLVLAVIWWRVGPHAGTRPASCQDLAPSVVAAVATRVPPPAETTGTPEGAFRSRIDDQIVRLFRQTEDARDATTLIAEARRIADHTRVDDASASLRDRADKLETVLRSDGLLTQADIERRAVDLRQNLNDWHGRLQKIGPDADFKTLERTFNDDVVRLSFDHVDAGLDNLRKATNQFVVTQGLKADTRFAAHFDGESSTWILEERMRFTSASVELLDIDASDIELAQYQDAPVPQIFLGESTDPITNLRSIPAPPGRPFVELRLESRVPANVVPICGARQMTTLLSFSAADLHWPRALDTLLRGHVKLESAGMVSVPFTVTLDRGLPIKEIGLPRYSLFAATAPVKIGEQPYEYRGRAEDSIEIANESISPQSLAIRPIRFELMPRPLRNPWVFSHRDLLFPLNLLLAGTYLVLAALAEEYAAKDT